jgi:hypothetical protein
MMTKAEHLEVLDQERARRLAAMGAAERRKHDEWVSSHAPGPASARASRKLMAAYESKQPSPQDLTIAELQVLIDELKALRAQRASEKYEGVFQ